MKFYVVFFPPVKGDETLYVDTSAYITWLFLLPRSKAGEVY